MSWVSAQNESGDRPAGGPDQHAIDPETRRVKGGVTEGPKEVKGLAFSPVDKQPVGVFTAKADLLADGDLLA
jgi:hypothetical protein